MLKFPESILLHPNVTNENNSVIVCRHRLKGIFGGIALIYLAINIASTLISYKGKYENVSFVFESFNLYCLFVVLLIILKLQVV